MAGAASDVSGDSWSGSKGTCMAARVKHQAKDEGGRGRGGGLACEGIVAGHHVKSLTATQASYSLECADLRPHTMSNETQRPFPEGT